MSTHGLSRDRLYQIWIDMRSRCNNLNLKCYHNYGGRGIKVCDEWNNYKNFYKWAIENGYDENLTIDRIDVNGNYEPLNCKWSTKKEQENNKRNNVVDYFNNELLTMSQFAIKIKQGFSRISYMYHNKNMSFDEINEYFIYHENNSIDIENTLNSMNYSKNINKRHSDILDKIKRMIKNGSLNNSEVTFKFYKDTQRQYRPCYLLSEKAIDVLNKG